MAKRLTIEKLNKKKHKNCILTPIKFIESKVFPNGSIQRQVECNCECGGTAITTPTYLMKGDKLSCGCLSVGRKVNKYKFEGKKMTITEIMEATGKNYDQVFYIVNGGKRKKTAETTQSLK